MSAYYIYKGDGGAKFMRPINNREEYLKIRNSRRQQATLKAVRKGDEGRKSSLEEVNYSCLPNDDGTLKGSKRASRSVGMDIDHIAPEELEAVRQRIMDKKDELGLLMLERSARREGYHLVFRRRPELSQEENLMWASQLVNVAHDKGAKDITRVFFTTTADEDELLFLDDGLFDNGEMEDVKGKMDDGRCKMDDGEHQTSNISPQTSNISPQTSALSPQPSAVDRRIRFIAEGVMKEKGLERKDFVDAGGRHTTVNIFLSGATQRRSREEVCGVLRELMPDHWGDENIQQLVSDFYQNYTKPNQRLFKYQEELFTQSRRMADAAAADTVDGDENEFAVLTEKLAQTKMPQGVSDSIAAVGPAMAMPALVTICPCIGALATGVQLDVHTKKAGLNLISYIVGEFASCKGDLDHLVDAWLCEIKAVDKMYEDQWEEWRQKKLAAKNKKEQPEEPKLPVRNFTLNNTVANLAERLANTVGKHALSFTPEADVLAQKWKSTVSDFSVMLRQAYDGSYFAREARSPEAVNVHIDHLLWNIVMCGTPDALYRVVSNYTDGLQSRIAIAQTPDNTYAALGKEIPVLTDRHKERIRQIAHLLPLMQGEIVLKKLEDKGREWLEKIRLETMMNADRVKARQRIRICVTTQRMVCCLMLCKVCEQLIQKHGLNGAEKQLKAHPDLWKTMLQKVQTPQMLEVYDVIADSLMANALYFFRSRIEKAYAKRDYGSTGISERTKRGKNDTIFGRLDVQFSFEQALQTSVALKGSDVTLNSVRQMLKNWRKQGLVTLNQDGEYVKS